MTHEPELDDLIRQDEEANGPHTCGTCSMLATHLAALLINDIATTGKANPDRKAMLDQLTDNH